MSNEHPYKEIVTLGRAASVTIYVGDIPWHTMKKMLADLDSSRYSFNFKTDKVYKMRHNKEQGIFWDTFERGAA